MSLDFASPEVQALLTLYQSKDPNNWQLADALAASLAYDFASIFEQFEWSRKRYNRYDNATRNRHFAHTYLQLEGAIPAFLPQCLKHLISLYWRSPDTNQPPPPFANLRHLHLSYLWGDMPTGFFDQMPKLETLKLINFLNCKRFDASWMQKDSNCQQLEFRGLTWPQLPKQLLQHLPNLLSLNLKNNQIQSLQASDFSRNAALETLHLGQNPLQEINLSFAQCLPNLRYLQFGQQPFQPDFWPSLHKHPNLEQLLFTGCTLKTLDLDTLQSLPKLKILRLYKNRFSLAFIEETKQALPQCQVSF